MKWITSILIMLASSVMGQDNLDDVWWHQSATAALPWSPSNTLSSFAGWWDPANVSSIQATSGDVTNMFDLSGNNKPMVEAGSSFRPTSGIRSQNGLNILDADGNDFLTAYTVGISTNGNAIFACVADIDAINNVADSIYGTSSSSANRFQLASSNNASFYPQLDQTSLGSADLNSGAAYNGPSIYVVYFNKSGSQYSVWVDGSNVTGNGTYSTSIGSPNQVFWFRNNAAQQDPDGAMGEFLVANIATVALRERIEGYLAWKWGLQGNLPAGHPYKNSPPTQ